MGWCRAKAFLLLAEGEGLEPPHRLITGSAVFKTARLPITVALQRRSVSRAPPHLAHKCESTGSVLGGRSILVRARCARPHQLPREAKPFSAPLSAQAIPSPRRSIP